MILRAIPLIPLSLAATRAASAGDFVRLDVEGGVLLLTAVGLDCRIRTVVPLEDTVSGRLGGLEGEDGVYIEADPLARALQLRGDDKPIDLTVSATNVLVQHGEYRLQLPRVRTVPFSFLPVVPSVCLPDVGVQDAIGRVVGILPREGSMGVLVEWSDVTIRILAVNKGRHAHTVVLPCPPVEPAGRFCFSRLAADQVVKLGSVASWWWGDDSLWFQSGAVATLRVSAVRDGYPQDVRPLFDDTFVMDAEVRVADLIAALRAVRVVLSKDDEHVMLATVGKIDDSVVFEVSGRSVRGGASATEKLLGRSASPTMWKGMCNIKDLSASLSTIVGDTVVVRLGQRTLVLADTDGCFHAVLSLMVM